MGLSAWRQGWFTPTAHLFVNIPSAAGLQIGTPVKLKGFSVGEVDYINLEPDLNVKVRLKITKARLALLGADASAKFGRDGPISGRFIEILPGARQGDRLKEDAVLAMDMTNELEDVMVTVRTAVEKMAASVAKIEPILDDTKTITGEAAAMRQDVRSAVTAMLKNLEAMTAQMKQLGTTASSMAGKLDGNRQAVVGDVQKILAQAQDAAASAQTALKALEKDAPVLLNSTKQALANAQAATDNARKATADVAQMLAESKADIPAAARNARAVTQDARVVTQDVAEITDGLKKTWPISSVLKSAGSAATATTSTLDAFEAQTQAQPASVPGAKP
jgi:ABC-type transporter Mla subunit MlaD